MSITQTPRISARQIQEREQIHRPTPFVNVGDAERWASAFGGGILLAYGIRQRTPVGLALAALGGGLLFRGATGHCQAYTALQIDTAGKPRVVDGNPVHHGRFVKQTTTIARSAADLYAFWRDEANSPKFMEGIESAHKTGEKTSHWVASGPLGTRSEWDAEIFADEPNRLFSWKTLPGALVPHVGTVKFEPISGGKETVVTVELNYEAPGGWLGQAAAQVAGKDPNAMTRENLRRFKQLLEAGEIATVAGQSSGRA